MILIHSSLYLNRWAALFCPQRGFPSLILNKSLQIAYPSTFCDYPRMCNEFFRELRSFHTLLLSALKTATEREGSNLHFSRPKLPLKHSNRFALFHLLCSQSVCPAIVRCSFGVGPDAINLSKLLNYKGFSIAPLT